MTTFTNTLKNRRSIYHLGRNVTLSNDELTALIKEAIKEKPNSIQRTVYSCRDSFWRCT